MMGNIGRGGWKEIYPDIIATLGGAAVTALTQMNGGTAGFGGAAAPSTYSPKADGSLLSIEIFIVAQAVTSLAQTGYVTLNCTTFVPQNTLTMGFGGFGIQTAPSAQVPANDYVQYPDLNLPVKTSVAIIASIVYAYSPVTPFAIVQGIFGAN
jgi:hypothetical protein